MTCEYATAPPVTCTHTGVDTRQVEALANMPPIAFAES
jgi:hypothetical protein